MSRWQPRRAHDQDTARLSTPVASRLWLYDLVTGSASQVANTQKLDALTNEAISDRVRPHGQQFARPVGGLSTSVRKAFERVGRCDEERCEIGASVRIEHLNIIYDGFERCSGPVTPAHLRRINRRLAVSVVPAPRLLL